jgi:hypothetical protein
MTTTLPEETRTATVTSRGLQELIDHLRAASFAKLMAIQARVLDDGRLMLDAQFNLKHNTRHVAFTMTVMVPLDGIDMNRELPDTEEV